MKLGFFLFSFQNSEDAYYIHVFNMAASIGLLEVRICIFESL